MQDCAWSQNLLVAQSRSTSVIGRLQEGLESDYEFLLVSLGVDMSRL